MDAGPTAVRILAAQGRSRVGGHVIAVTEESCAGLGRDAITRLVVVVPQMAAVCLPQAA